MSAQPHAPRVNRRQRPAQFLDELVHRPVHRLAQPRILLWGPGHVIAEGKRSGLRQVALVGLPHHAEGALVAAFLRDEMLALTLLAGSLTTLAPHMVTAL